MKGSKGSKETQEGTKERLERCIKRIATPRERELFREVLSALVEHNSIPLELLEVIPKPPYEVGKTRFDQLYDAALSLVFPSYDTETLKKFLGPNVKDLNNTKIWRAFFPSKLNISSVLFRASSFQEAFGLACDYANRVSLRLYKKIPTDMTIRVQFVSERSLNRMLSIRWANRKKAREKYKLVGREFSSKELSGARLAALGNPKGKNYSIFKYADAKDLRMILRKMNKTRISKIEKESFVKDD